VASVKEKGILQPILVRRHPSVANRFEIVAGERRWRAAQQAQLFEVPIIIKDLTDKDSLEIALIENIQRESLTPLEEAEGYRRLMDEFSHTQDALARTVGKSRSHVANTLRLLVLPEQVKILVDAGDLTAGHARALINADDPEALAQQVVKKGLNVRQTERLAQSAKNGTKPVRKGPQKDADTVALEDELSGLLGLRVNIRFSRGGGTLTIAYKTLEQLDDVLHRLNQGGVAGAGDGTPIEGGSLASAVADGDGNPARLSVVGAVADEDGGVD
ncbi:MAG: ParB/RepB/Spo0J family partition protein, partial [Alphaproteobacteria bacterium]